ncbi:hypothetical protein MAR621_00561 [Maribacter dokdonensis]|uniref:hypothetical protein n=1 Tax=Maribacter dokdonensis TaxID=320912 RepID=UPI001AFCDF43|nr:hypothetical protein [Maribacter dokdonensis]CAG2534738.1 hypothetical protein MAR621_00561 [Maribacter dokdonensis]
MTKEALAKLSTQELVNKYTMAKTIVWLFSIILILALLFVIYISIQDGLTPLLAVPLALSAIIPLNVKNMNTFKKELDSRL